MSKFQAPRRRAGWTAAIGSLAVILMISFAWISADEGVSRTKGLFGFRNRDRDRRKEEPPPEPKSIKPPGVPNAPPAQNLAAINQADDPQDPVLRRVEEAIRITKRRFLNAEKIGQSPSHTPWQIMHGLLALRHELELKTNHGMVNAIEFVSQAPVFRGEYWFEKTRFGGRGHPYSQPYHFEGHVNQFLALLTMANLPLNHKFTVANGQVVTMSDMIRHAQMMVNSNEEISWTLWFLTHYIEPDATWVNAQGQRWSMEMLVRLQTDDEVTTSPCGGTHGLFALAYARNSYLQKHGRLSGVWIEADQKIERYVALAKSMQNRDGTFSSQFFREAKWSADGEARLTSSGHMLEWLMMALPQQQLSQKWVRDAVASVATDLVRFSNTEIDPGPLFHALHAIVLYRERMSPRTLNPVDPKPLLTQQPKSGSPPVAMANPQPPKPIEVLPQPESTVPPLEPSPKPVAEKPSTAKKPADEFTMPDVAGKNRKPAMEKPVATDAPMPKLPMPAAPGNETAPGKLPDPAVAAELPPLPSLTAPKGSDPGMKAAPAQTKPADPAPEDRPIQPQLAADPPAPPPLKIAARNTEGLEKPKAAATGAPPAPVVTQPTPVVLPPLPLDPIDQPAAGDGAE